MTLYFPDLNVWLALSDRQHLHSTDAWRWLKNLGGGHTLIFCRFTQIGLLRLLTSRSVMDERALTLRKAWTVYDRWLEDPSVNFYPEPRTLDAAFRLATAGHADRPAPNAIADCYLLAYATQLGATLVTFDRGLHRMARLQEHPAVVPG